MRTRYALLVPLLLDLGTLTGLARDLDPERAATWPGYLRGSPRLVAVSDDYAWVAASALLVVDVRNPHQPELARVHARLANVAEIVVSDGRACAFDWNVGLVVVDARDPEAVPITVPGWVPHSGHAPSLAVAGDLLLAALPDSGLHLLDLRDPRQPNRLAMLPVRGASKVVASAGLAYLIERLPRDAGRLHIFDLADPAHPRSLGTLDTTRVPGYLAVADGRVALSIPGKGLVIVDAREPSNPKEIVVSAIGGTDGGPVAMAWPLVFLVGAQGLEGIDFAEPASPVRLGNTAMDSWPENLAVSEGFVYWASQDSGLRILDVRIPDQPAPAGSLITNGDARDLVVSGTQAFLADGAAGLQVFDLTDLRQPKPVARLGSPHPSIGVALSEVDSIGALVSQRSEDGLGLLEVIDLADPRQPRRLGGLDLDGTPTGVAVSNRLAYVAHWRWNDRFDRHRARLEIVDLRDPRAPRSIGTHETEGRTADLAVSGPLVYLTGVDENQGQDRMGWLEVLDVRQPDRPLVVGTYRSRGEPSALAIAGPFAYLAGREWDDGRGGGESLLILDVSDPTRPLRVGGYSGGLWGRQVAVADEVAYLADYGWDGFVEVLDVRDPTAPVRRGGFAMDGLTRAMVPVGRHLVLADGNFHSAWFGSRGEGLVVMDALRPAGLRQVGRWKIDGGLDQVATSGRLAYAASSSNGLAIVDFAETTHPRLSALHATRNTPIAIATTGDRAYLIEESSTGNADTGSLTVLEIGTSANPRVLGRNAQRRLNGLAVSGRHVYAFEDGFTVQAGTDSPWSRLDVYDVGDPTDPRLIGEHSTNRSCTALAVAGTNVFLARPSYGLDVYDVGDPSRPRHSGHYETLGWIPSMVTSGRQAYLASEGYWTGNFGSRLEVLDLIDPDRPRLVGRVEITGRTTEVAVAGAYAYLLTERGGIQVFDISDPTHPRRVGGNSAFTARGLAATRDAVIAAGPGGLRFFDPFDSLRLGRPEPIAGGGVRLRCSGAIGRNVVIQRAAELTGWEDWRTLTLDAETVEVTEDAPPGPRAFYRVRGAP